MRDHTVSCPLRILQSHARRHLLCTPRIHPIPFGSLQPRRARFVKMFPFTKVLHLKVQRPNFISCQINERVKQRVDLLLYEKIRNIQNC